MRQNPARHHLQKRVIHQTRSDGSVKTREIHVPSDELKREQQSILRVLQADIPLSPHATGGVPGKTLLDNVRPHQQNNHFYKLDLRDAFASVDKPTLRKALSDSPGGWWWANPLTRDREWPDWSLGYLTEAVGYLSKGLPLGLPTSPFLFNVYCKPMDDQLSSYCADDGITYTRYLDDLTFSTREPLGKRRRAALRDRIQATPGMVINRRKSQLHHLARGPVTITGISLYPDRRMMASPALMQTAADTFAEVRSYAEWGTFVSEEDIGRLHGYHGVIHQLSTSETPALRNLDQAYQAALGALAIET